MDILEYLEKARLTRFHYTTLVVSFAIYGLTAMNVMMISVALPRIKVEWNLDPITSGNMLSAGYIGMFIGAILSGRLSDIIGRKRTLILMLVVESIFTALNAIAVDVVSLSLLRFIAGVGLGGTLPIPGVYVSEYPPARYRGRFVGIVETAWVWGVLLGIVLGYIIIPQYGWRPVFLLALLPLLLIPIVSTYLPESIRHLLKKGRTEDALNLLKKHGLIPDDVKTNTTSRIDWRYVRFGEALATILGRKYLKRTIVLWTLWAALVYTYHGIFLWLPTVYYEKFQYETVKTLWWVLVVTSAQIPGYYSAALLLDKAGRKGILVPYLTIAGIACFLLAVAGNINSILALSLVISFFNLGAWSALYAYTPELYPTEIRGTASGIAASIGRLAGILAPSITGFLMSIAKGEVFWAYMVFGAVHLLAAFITMALGSETRGKSLESLEM